jgi:predicted DCC family thiol-disulfide oxidoreductase YuxK
MTDRAAPSPTGPTPADGPGADVTAGRAVVLFDGGCPLCRRSVRVLKRLDWFRRLHFEDCRDPARVPKTPAPLDPGRMLEAMHLVTPDRRRVYVGFEAVRWVAWRLPAMMSFAGLLYLPGAAPLGHRLYVWVAKNRYRLVPCAGGVCHVPRGKPRSSDGTGGPGSRG